MPWVSYDFMLQHPFESLEDLKETYFLVKELPGRYVLQLHGLNFLPGTDIVSMAVEQGLFTQAELDRIMFAPMEEQFGAYWKQETSLESQLWYALIFLWQWEAMRERCLVYEQDPVEYKQEIFKAYRQAQGLSRRREWRKKLDMRPDDLGCGKKNLRPKPEDFSKAKQRSQLVGALGIHGIGTILDPILADGILRSVLVDVVGDHQGLVAVLNLQGVVEARSVDVGTHSLLGQTDSHGVLGGDDAGQLQASGNQVLALVNNLGHQAQVPSFISVDEVTGQHHLISTAGADQTRQEVGGGHVAAADAHVGIEAGETSGLGADTNVRAHSQREATASGDVVDQGDPGLRSLSNEPLQLAQLNLIVIEAGNGLLVVGQALLDIQAGAEALALVAAIQQDNADVVVLVNQPLGELGQLTHQVVGQGVVSLGSVQGDLQDVGLDPSRAAGSHKWATLWLRDKQVS